MVLGLAARSFVRASRCLLSVGSQDCIQVLSGRRVSPIRTDSEILLRMDRRTVAALEDALVTNCKQVAYNVFHIDEARYPIVAQGMPLATPSDLGGRWTKGCVG